MSLQDDLDEIEYALRGDCLDEFNRLRALLSHPGARVWLAALPGLMELGEKATGGNWFTQNEGDPGESGVMAIGMDGSVHQITRNFVCLDEDAFLIAALRNALHAAAAAAQEGGGE